MKRTLALILLALTLSGTALAAGFVDDGLYRPARTRFTKVSVNIKNPRRLAGVVVLVVDTNGTIIASQDIGRKRLATFTDLPEGCRFYAYWYDRYDLHSPVGTLLYRPPAKKRE